MFEERKESDDSGDARGERHAARGSPVHRCRVSQKKTLFVTLRGERFELERGGNSSGGGNGSSGANNGISPFLFPPWIGIDRTPIFR